MDGKKFVVLMLTAVVVLSVVTFALYLLTRDEDYVPPESRLSNEVPAVMHSTAAPAYGVMATS